MVIIKITTTTGPSATRKSINPNPVALPIIMFGGSPISVAVPPIFAIKISGTKKGIGFSSRVSVITKVTGTINKTVVTLSSSAEAKAVITQK